VTHEEMMAEIHALHVNIESLHESISELHATTQEHTRQVEGHTRQLEIDAENIRALARIADIHERRLTALENPGEE
jgi:hypothetical protein